MSEIASPLEANRMIIKALGLEKLKYIGALKIEFSMTDFPTVTIEQALSIEQVEGLQTIVSEFKLVPRDVSVDFDKDECALCGSRDEDGVFPCKSATRTGISPDACAPKLRAEPRLKVESLVSVASLPLSETAKALGIKEKD